MALHDSVAAACEGTDFSSRHHGPGSSSNSLETQSSSQTQRQQKHLPAPLPHVDGARAIAVLWLVCRRVLPAHPEVSAVSAFKLRADVGAEWLFLLAGFMAHRAYSCLEADGGFAAGTMLFFYVSHCVRIITVTQGTILLGALVHAAAGEKGQPSDLLSCTLLVRPWLDPGPGACPGEHSWLVASLAASWLLYPLLTRRCIARAALLDRDHPLVGFCIAGAGLSLWSLLPQVAMWLRGVPPLDVSWSLVWFWPPAHLATFAQGACAAAAAQRAPPSRRGVVLADLLLAVLLLACWLAPPATTGGRAAATTMGPAPVGLRTPLTAAGPEIAEGSEGDQGVDVWTPRAAAPVLALFLYGITRNGCTARLLKHPALVGAGTYAMEALLLHGPLYLLFTTFLEPWLPLSSAPTLIAYLLLLWLLAMLAVEGLAAPLEARVVQASSGWIGKPVAWFLGREPPPCVDL